MKRQILMEYRKLWNKVAVVAVTAMFVMVTLHLLIYLNLQYRSINSRGEIVEGLTSYRALKETSKELEGVMDGAYIQNLITSYNSSFDKAYFAEHRGFLGTGGMTKYMVPNYFINYVYFGSYMSNGNNKVGLDYDFLESEAVFYAAYKETVKEHLAFENIRDWPISGHGISWITAWCFLHWHSDWQDYFQKTMPAVSRSLPFLPNTEERKI